MATFEKDLGLYHVPLRHKKSGSSDGGRILVPMWDSSDPERAPPPLPLNPQSPAMHPRTGISSAIQSAHLALSEKAREANGPAPSPLSRRADMPENQYPPGARPLPIPGPQNTHHRMQSLQPSVRDRSMFLEGMPPKSSEKNDLRPVTPNTNQNLHDVSNGSPGPVPGPSLTPIIRPVARRTHQSILGDNTPPQSATMMALNNMPSSRDQDAPPTVQPLETSLSAEPLHVESTMPEPPPQQQQQQQQKQHSFVDTSITAPSQPAPASIVPEQSTPKARPLERARVNSDADVFSLDLGRGFAYTELGQQLSNLTRIASALQKDMSALTRRSRDNAADLLSLKQATNARDEDIRKGLRNLIENVDEVRRAGFSTKEALSGATTILDSRPFNSQSPTSTKDGIRAFNLPRIPTPNSFATSLDRESISTPSLYGGQESHVVNLIERIVREMGTKEGLDMILNRLSELADKVQGMPSALKINELIDQLRMSRSDLALRPVKPASESGSVRSRVMSFEGSHAAHSSVGQPDSLGIFNEATSTPRPPSSASAVVTDDVLKVIHSVKDSVAQGGGLTAEVKALVRELRGEILGMGRDLNSRLEELEAKGLNVTDPEAHSRETARIIHESINDLKAQMDGIIRERHRPSSSVSHDGPVDYQEIYNAMRTALKDNAKASPGLTQEDVILAVKDAWDNYKPEIEIQQYGLERDEVLAVLKEGLQSRPGESDAGGITQAEVYQAVIDGLQHYQPPRLEAGPALSRIEILDAVRECLEEFEFPVAPGAPSLAVSDATREEISHAVREGLRDFKGFSSTDVTAPDGALNNDEIMDKLTEIVTMLRSEFTAVSLEAKQNVAATSCDTEAIINSTRSGLDKLRFDIESYIERLKISVATSNAGSSRPSDDVDQSPSINSLARSLDNFREEVNRMLQNQTESLRDTVNMSLVPASVAAPAMAGGSKEVLEAVRDGIDSIRGELRRPLPGTTEILDALHEGLGDLHLNIDRMRNKPADLTANDEILDALNKGLSMVRAEITDLRHLSTQAMVPATRSVHSDSGEAPRGGDFRHLEFLISQLFDRIDKMPQGSGGPVPEGLARSDDIRHLELLMGELRTKVDELTEATINAPVPDPQEIPLPDEGVRHEDIQKLEFLVTQLHDKLEKLSQTQTASSDLHVINRSAPDGVAPIEDVKTEDIKNLETLITKLHDKVESAPSVAADVPSAEAQSSISSDDVARIISTMDTLKNTVEKMASRAEAAAEAKKDTEPPTEDATLAAPGVTRDDFETVEAILRNTKASIDELVSSDHTVRKEHVDHLEMLLLETRQSLSAVTTQLESVCRRQDVYTLQALISQMAARHDQAISAGGTAAAAAPASEPSAVPEAPLFPPSQFPIGQSASGEDIANLSNSLKTSMSVLAESHSMSVANRQTEIATMTKNFADIKTMVEEFHAVMTVKLEDGFTVFDSINAALEIVAGISAKNESVADILRDFVESAKTEFEETRGSIVGAKLDSEEKMQTTTDSLLAKLDVLEEILGVPSEPEHNVSAQLATIVSRNDEDRENDTVRHTELAEAIASIKEPVSELQPIIAVAMKEVLDKVVEHYEHSQETAKAAQARIDEIYNKPDPVFPNPYDDTSLQAKIENIAASEADALAKLTPLVDEEQGALIKLVTIQEHGSETHKRLDVVTVQGEELREQVGKTMTDIGEIKTTMSTISDNGLLLQDKLEQVNTDLVEKLETLAKHDHLEALETSMKEKLTDLEAILGEKLGGVDITLAEKLTAMDVAAGERTTNVSKTVTEKLGEMATILETGVSDKLGEVAEKITLVDGKMTSLETAITDKVTAIDNSVTENFATMHSTVTESFAKNDTALSENFATLNSQITDKFTGVETSLAGITGVNEAVTGVSEKLMAVDDKLDTVNTGIMEKLTGMDETMTTKFAAFDEQLGKKLTGFDSDLTEKLVGMDDSLAGKISAVGTGVSEKIDKLMENDAAATAQLTTLVSHSETTKESLAKLEGLEKVQEQVLKAAAEISAFLATQMQKSTEETDKVHKSLADANIALAQRNSEKEAVEASIAALREEEARLRESVITLRTDQELLSRQRTKLAADVSSLETALGLRREELRQMEDRAEGLERRIIEGVMNHSRVLLMVKGRSSSKAASGDAMNRKRVKNLNGGDTDSSILLGNASPAAPVVNLALSARRRLGPPSASKNGESSSRRIASLGQISGSNPAGGMKRSNSVRTGGKESRKASWGGALSDGKRTASGAPATSADKAKSAAAAAAGATTVMAVGAEDQSVAEEEEEDEEEDEEDEEENEESEEGEGEGNEEDNDGKEEEETDEEAGPETNSTIVKNDDTEAVDEEEEEEEEEEESDEDASDSNEEFEEASEGIEEDAEEEDDDEPVEVSFVSDPDDDDVEVSKQ